MSCLCFTLRIQDTGCENDMAAIKGMPNISVVGNLLYVRI